jgi:predicted nicotinamide N-methyase
MLELGCGTGLSGLSLLVSPCNTLKILYFTDKDEHILSLCRKNVEANLNINTNCVCSFTQLVWGDQASIHSLQNELIHMSRGTVTGFDTIIATDVLYDVSSLGLILNTVYNLARDNAYFVLALVPRLSLHDSRLISTTDEIEEWVEMEAKAFNMHRMWTIRPMDIFQLMRNTLPSKQTENLREMESIGACIIIFKLVR